MRMVYAAALAMVIAGLLFLNGVDPWIASAMAIAACTAIGAGMGFFVTRVGLHHFIVSLAVMVIARGLCLLGTGGRPLGLYTLLGLLAREPLGFFLCLAPLGLDALLGLFARQPFGFFPCLFSDLFSISCRFRF